MHVNGFGVKVCIN